MPASSNVVRPGASRTAATTLAAACIATAMLMLDVAVINTALPRIARDLGAGLGGIQWVIDGYTLTLASIVLTAGSVADKVGRRRSFLAGLAVFLIGSVACGAAASILVLNLARAVQGVGGAVLFATSLALIGDAFPETSPARAKALAVYGATIGASFAVGPLVGGALTSGFGWRSIFYLNVPIGLLCLALARRVPESRELDARPADWLGQSMLACGLLLLVLALLRGNPDGWASATTVSALAGGVTMLAAFVLVERRVRAPMLPLSLFADRRFAGAQVAAFGISASMFAVYLYTTLYLQGVLGLSPIRTGLVYLPGTVVMVVVSAASSSLAERVSPRLLVAGGLVLVAVGILMWLRADVHSSTFAVLPGLVVSMIGTGALNPALSALVLETAPVGQTALASGINDTFRQVGVAVGVAGLGALFTSGTGTPAVEFVHAFRHALIAAATVALLGALTAGALLLDGGRRVSSVVLEVPGPV